jgi:hypothetical protein
MHREAFVQRAENIAALSKCAERGTLVESARLQGQLVTPL